MTALTGKTAKVKYTAAAFSTAAGEAFTSLSPTTDRTEFRITDATKRHWTQDQPPVVLVNSTAHSDFTVNYVQGKITFTGTPLTVAESAQVTATVYWLTASYLPGVRTWSMDADTDMLDVTTLSTSTADVQWRTFTPGLQGAVVDMGRIVDTPTTDTPVWFDHLNTGQDVILELVMHSGGSTYKFEAYGLVDADAYSVPTDGLEEESVTFQVTSEMFYATTE